MSDLARRTKCTTCGKRKAVVRKNVSLETSIPLTHHKSEQERTACYNVLKTRRNRLRFHRRTSVSVDRSILQRAAFPSMMISVLVPMPIMVMKAPSFSGP